MTVLTREQKQFLSLVAMECETVATSRGIGYVKKINSNHMLISFVAMASTGLMMFIIEKPSFTSGAPG